jgi:hypothetical protein
LDHALTSRAEIVGWDKMRSRSKVESVMVGDASKLGRRAYAALTEPTLRHEILDVAA